MSNKIAELNSVQQFYKDKTIFITGGNQIVFIIFLKESLVD